MPVQIIDGDLFQTHAKYICHQVNCQARMGSGVAKQVRAKYPEVYNAYVGFCNEERNVFGRTQFAANGNDCCAVIGISGGKDSSVVAALCVEALGVERVIGVLMPNGRQKDIADSKLLVDTLGIASVTVDIGGAYSKMVDVVGRVMPSGVSNQAAVNLPPRLRMATLYMVAQSLARGGRVANTCNRSEDYVGYSTKFGDSAGDFSPLANIMVHEVRQIGYELPIPRELVDKTPSDGLCGKTDEDNLGFTYMQLDNYIMHGSSGDEDIDKVIAKKHMQNLHKLNPMPAYGSQP